MQFEIDYKESGNARQITYELKIDLDNSRRPYALKERLRQRRKNQKYGRPFSFLYLNDGEGVVWKGEEGGGDIGDEEEIVDILEFLEKPIGDEAGEESKETEVVGLEDKRKLGIGTLGSLKQHPRISAFRRFIEGWHLSYFDPNAARSLPLAL